MNGHLACSGTSENNLSTNLRIAACSAAILSLICSSILASSSDMFIQNSEAILDHHLNFARFRGYLKLMEIRCLIELRLKLIIKLGLLDP